LIAPCVGGTVEREDENCDHDNLFLSRNPLPDFSSVSDLPNADFYDDFALIQKSPRNGIWNDDNTTTGRYAVARAERVGVGVLAPESKLHVGGNALIEDDIMTDAICSYTLGDDPICFQTALIVGDEEDMDCRSNDIAADQPAVRIGDSRLNCAVPVDLNDDPLENDSGGVAFGFSSTNLARIECPSGQAVISITNGVPLCG
jgi:hypothetical protein